MRHEMKANTGCCLVPSTSRHGKSGREETLSSFAPLSSSSPLVLALFPFLSLSIFTLLCCIFVLTSFVSISASLLFFAVTLIFSYCSLFYHIFFLFVIPLPLPYSISSSSFPFFLINFYPWILHFHFADISPLAFSPLLPPRPLAIIFLFVLNALFINVPSSSPFKYHDERFHSLCISNLNLYGINFFFFLHPIYLFLLLFFRRKSRFFLFLLFFIIQFEFPGTRLHQLNFLWHFGEAKMLIFFRFVLD